MSMLIQFLCLLIPSQFGPGDLIPKHSALEALLSKKGLSGVNFDTQGWEVYLILNLSFPENPTAPAPAGIHSLIARFPLLVTPCHLWLENEDTPVCYCQCQSL